jgi:DNA-binding MarR family transcriptional regulator
MLEGMTLPGSSPTPGSPEEAVLLMTMRLGKRLRMRQPGDEVDAAAVPLLRVLTCTGSMRLSDLAHRMQLDASTVSRHVRHLEERGLLERAEDPDDRRAAKVAITAPGRKALEHFMQQRRRTLGEVLAAWPERDRRRLQELATRLEADLDV